MFRFVCSAIVFSIFALPAAASKERPCFLDGFETPVRCVFLVVPLDYAHPEGEHITVVAAVAAATRVKAEGAPLIVLAGGPGQAATGMGPWLNSAFKKTRTSRDIILFDIRGTGRSGALSCQFTLTATSDAEAQMRRDAAACAKHVGPQGAFYSSREIVEDLERFRVAMGFKKIALWGGSFGTRIAQHYVRAYGAHVAAVVLDAATPVTETIFAGAPVTGERALQRLFADCESDAACHAAFPKLRADFDTLMTRAEGSGLAVKEANARSGAMEEFVLDRDGASGMVRGALYASLTRALVPYAITQAVRGNLKPLLALGAATSEWSVETMSLGSMLSIICAEDFVRARRGDPAALSFGFMKYSYFRYFNAACSVWPRRELPAAMFQALTSRVPAMVISGEADLVTPPSSGATTLKQFSPGVHVIVPDGFHTNSSNRCVAGLMARFLDNPAAGGRDHSCLKRSRKPRFLTSPNV